MISKERFREVAVDVGWVIERPGETFPDRLRRVADALHALYVAEHVGVHVIEESEYRKRERLASIKETARLYASCNSTLDFAFSSAEAFEAEFERRYGGGA